MEKQLPKNVRQIGNTSDNPKIYVEDYVDTFLNQLCERTEETPIGAILIGENVHQEEQDCVYIWGAVQLKEVTVKGKDLLLEEDTMKQAYEECKEFFGESAILGWFITMPDMPMVLTKNLLHIQEKHFSNEHSIFIMKEPKEKEEIYHAYKYKELMPLGGHYIYYEKNPSMQDYMIASRKKIGVTPSEVVEDRAAKDFRSIVKERMAINSPKQSGRFVYALSTFLVLVILAIGITTINNYDKMKSVQSSLDHISQTVTGQKEEKPKAKEASSSVVENGTADVENPAAAGEKIEGQTPAGAGMENGVYVVEKGDTLALISKKAYGDISHVEAICKMNGLKDGNLIFIGQKLILP